MFTCLIEELGKIAVAKQIGDIFSVCISCEKVLSELQAGDSISVSGICLTVVKIDSDSFWIELVSETLQRTTAKSWVSGTIVNLERALSFSDRLGGHLVQGHVDGTSRVECLQVTGDSWEAEFFLGKNFTKYISEKGSIAIDGVSLTVAELSDETFRVCLIPKTLQMTTLGSLSKGDQVNIEVDIIAKYLEKLLDRN